MASKTSVASGLLSKLATWVPGLYAVAPSAVSGETIGQAGSGATYAGTYTSLFAYLWNTFTNTQCPVSGGRTTVAYGPDILGSTWVDDAPGDGFTWTLVDNGDGTITLSSSNGYSGIGTWNEDGTINLGQNGVLSSITSTAMVITGLIGDGVSPYNMTRSASEGLPLPVPPLSIFGPAQDFTAGKTIALPALALVAPAATDDLVNSSGVILTGLPGADVWNLNSVTNHGTIQKNTASGSTLQLAVAAGVTCAASQFPWPDLFGTWQGSDGLTWSISDAGSGMVSVQCSSSVYGNSGWNFSPSNPLTLTTSDYSFPYGSTLSFSTTSAGSGSGNSGTLYLTRALQLGQNPVLAADVSGPGTRTLDQYSTWTGNNLGPGPIQNNGGSHIGQNTPAADIISAGGSFAPPSGVLLCKNGTFDAASTVTGLLRPSRNLTHDPGFMPSGGIQFFRRDSLYLVGGKRVDFSRIYGTTIPIGGE